MNYSELTEVVDEVIAAWPVFSPQERRALLIRKLENQDYLKAKQGLDDLVMTYKGIPTIADIIEAIKNSRVAVVVEDCSICQNEGWILLDPSGHGTYKKCSCGNQGRREDRFYDDPNHTSEGKIPASLDESCWALYKARKEDDPDLSDDDVCQSLVPFWPQRAARLRELLDEMYADTF